MHLEILNSKNQKITKKEIEYATYWIAERLMGKRLCNVLSITIKFCDIKHDRAYCDILDDEKYPRMFLIELSKNKSRNQILKDIAHELVHVKQFARRELIGFETHRIPKYNGKEINTDKIPYWEWPWEIEAYGREIGLFSLYREHLNDNPDIEARLTN